MEVGTRWLLHRTDNVVVNNNSVRVFERRENGEFMFTEYLIRWQMYGKSICICGICISTHLFSLIYNIRATYCYADHVFTTCQMRIDWRCIQYICHSLRKIPHASHLLASQTHNAIRMVLFDQIANFCMSPRIRFLGRNVECRVTRMRGYMAQRNNANTQLVTANLF